MASYEIYQDMATRTGGDVYIGVVGPVRTGKSTFIQKFMDQVVLPRIENEDLRARAVDELPQSSAGRTIMTTEPKFIPESAIPVTVGENITFRTRLIDCVGYIVPSALGYIEEDQPRMVQTPWFEEEVPFNMAAAPARSSPNTAPLAWSSPPTEASAIFPGRNTRKRRSGSSGNCRRSESRLW